MKLSKTLVAAGMVIACTGYLALAQTPLDQWLIKRAASEPMVHSIKGAAIQPAAALPVASAAATAKNMLENALAAMIQTNRADKTIEKQGGKQVVTNQTSMLVLVNKKRELPADYVPSDLTVPDVPFTFEEDHPKKQLRKPAARALERLFAAAKEDGIELKAVSGYRSYATQKAIFERNVEQKGEQEANRTSARPGQSEHQTGLAMDVSSKSVGYNLVASYGETTEGKWLRKHGPEYGFIIRYEQGMEKKTGYDYEPWHLRFVGVDAAKRIAEKSFILESFLAG